LPPDESIKDGLPPKHKAFPPAPLFCGKLHCAITLTPERGPGGPAGDGAIVWERSKKSKAEMAHCFTWANRDTQVIRICFVPYCLTPNGRKPHRDRAAVCPVPGLSFHSGRLFSGCCEPRVPRGKGVHRVNALQSNPGFGVVAGRRKRGPSSALTAKFMCGGGPVASVRKTLFANRILAAERFLPL